MRYILLKKCILTVVMILVGMALFTIATELYMRTRFVPGCRLAKDLSIVMYIPNSVTQFEGCIYRIPPVTVITNSYGMRDINYTKEKPDNTIRIAVIGDSFVFGWGVELNETFLKVTEQNLNRKISNNVEVMNFGKDGTSGMQKIDSLEFASEFQPDMVIFQFFGDDVRQDKYPVNYQTPHRFEKLTIMLRKLHMKSTATFVSSLAQSASDREEAETDESKAETYYNELIKTVHNLSTEKGFSVIAVIHGTPKNQTEFIYNECAKLGLMAVKLEDILQSFPYEDTVISKPDGHWNAYGHKVVGEYLTPIVYREITDKNND